MPTVSINHVTRYRYRRDVAFGEHRILTRPRESYDQRVLRARLDITPEPESLRWIQDVFGNAVAIACFDRRSDELEIRASAEVEHLPLAPSAIAVEEYAQTYPFTYSAEDMPDLLRSIERRHSDYDREVDAWARGFLPSEGAVNTLDLLTDITRGIHREFSYARRDEKGIQTPQHTLQTRAGTCRDFAMLMIEAVRSLGFAARFVSGYLYNEEGTDARVGGHSTHAWLRAFLPGSGWIEFDPTNGIVGNRGLIRVAVARDSEQAKPLTGSWRGTAGSQIDMHVDVRIKHVELETRHPQFASRESEIMLIRTGYDISFETDLNVPMVALLHVRPEREGDLKTPQVLHCEPDVPRRQFVDRHGNIATRFVMPAGGIRLHADFVIEDSGLPDPVAPEAQQIQVADLPDEVLIYLMSSRYCETSLLADEAWQAAGSIEGGWAKVQALVDLAHERIKFDYQRASTERTARSAFDERYGVCRDFAHLAIALCRAVNIPARYCTGYLGDIGIDPFDDPMDFSAWMEVYLGGRWYAFDARHNRPRIARIPMARGRDATDTAITTSFGQARLVHFEVHTDEVASIDLSRPPAETALPQSEGCHA